MRSLFKLNDNLKIYIVIKKCNFKPWEKIIFFSLALCVGIAIAFIPAFMSVAIAFLIYNKIVSSFDNGEFPKK